jgi:hypothetical protein
MLDQTRRDFLKTSAIAAGAVAGGATFLIPAEARANSDDVDPNNYPWSVNVGAHAKATLLLIDGYQFPKYPPVPPITLTELLYERSLALTLDHMIKKLNHTTSADAKKSDYDGLVAALGNEGNLANLATALNDAQAAVAGDGDGNHSYMDYALIPARDPGNGKPYWPDDVYLTLTALAVYICVPLLLADRVQAGILNQSKAEVSKKGKSRPVHHLFTTAIRGSAMERKERLLWHQARDAGVLWCAPYPITSDSAKKLDQLAGKKDMGATAVNNKQCVNGVCQDGAGYYCQMVDNQCNTMS